MFSTNFTLGAVSSFDHHTQDWKLYKGRLQQWFIANSIGEDNDKAGVKRKVVLLSALTENTYQLACNLALPEDLDTKNFQSIIQILDEHFLPKRCGFADKFYTAVQQTGETHSQWAARLRGLATYCAFKNLEDYLLDKFVMGMLPGHERDKLFAKEIKDLTLSKAVELAESVRCARAGAAVLPSGVSNGNQDAVFKIDLQGNKGSRQQNSEKCLVCGYKNHKSSECRFSNYTCKLCNRKGHLRKMCSSNKVNYVEPGNADDEGDDVSSPLISAVKLDIDGKVDFGPKWNYEFKINRSTSDRTPSVKHERKRLVSLQTFVIQLPENGTNYQRNTTIHKNELGHQINNESIVTADPKKFEDTNDTSKVLKKSISSARNSDMYVTPRKVKHDARITKFTIHIYKQSRKIFDALKDKTTDEDIKKKIDRLSRNYEDKFGAFVQDTQEQTIKTRLGTEKVIINTLDTSNRILNRLVNFLIGEMDTNILRNAVTGNVFQNELKKKLQIENNHICKKFSICRSQNGYSQFLIDTFDIMLSSDFGKLRTINDALTEALRNTDLSRVMDIETEMHYQKGLTRLETVDTTLVFALFSLTKNIIINRHRPIQVVGKIDSRLEKTIGLLEMVDAIDKALPPDEANKLEWEDIKRSLTEWKDGSRKDIQEIMQSLVNNFKKGVDSFDNDTATRFEKNLNVILGNLK